jgi:hypothetical protein
MSGVVSARFMARKILKFGFFPSFHGAFVFHVATAENSREKSNKVFAQKAICL